MTDQINLGLIWAKTGEVTAVPNAKYEGGWVAEIPTFQNFNYMIQGLDKNTLHFAEHSSYDWQGDINYKVGSKVLSNGTLMTCVQDNLNQDPTTDGTGSYWVQGTHFGEAPSDLTKSDGVLVEFTPRSGNLYSGQDQTVVNNIPLVVLETTSGTTKNWAVGNVGGEVTVSDLGNSGAPDTRDLSKDQGNTHRVFHEGHLPTVGEVVGGVEEAPTNGKLYARKGLTAASGEWVTVTATDVTNEPPPPVNGAGQGWYNLADGRFYIDINDGDSSQWVPASPPMVPVSAANSVTYDDTVNDLGSTVQEAISTLHSTAYNPNIFTNGNFSIWQRGTSFSGLDALIADRWKVNSTFYTGGTSIHTQQSNFIEGNYYQLDVAGHTSDRAFLAQSLDLESMPLSFFSGKTFTITYDIDSSSSMEASVHFNLRTVDGNNNNVFTNLDTPVFESVTTGRQTKSYTYTFPDLSGYSSQIQAGDHINFHILMRTSASTDVIPDGTYKFYNVKMEESPEFTGWPHVDHATELAKCQRYYETGYEHHRFQAPYTVATFTAMVDFKTSKRALPSVSLTTAHGLGTETSNAITFYDTSASTYYVHTSFNVSDATSNEGFMFYKNDIYDANDFTSFFWIADSEL